MVTASLALAGYLTYKPVLKNADKPFIDLSEFTGNAIGNASKAYMEANPSPTPKAVPTLMPTVTPRPSVTPSTSVEIEVRGELITDGKAYYNSAAEFVTAFESGNYKGKSFVLIDNYAESKTYKRLIRLFEEARVSYRKERRQ